MKEALMALALRCQNAKEPDMWLDGDIAEALKTCPNDGRWTRNIKRVTGGTVDHPTTWYVPTHLWNPDERWPQWTAPSYTRSLDAALSLVPKDHDWILEHTNGGLTISARVGHNDPERAAWGDTPALALCNAALRAHAELMR